MALLDFAERLTLDPAGCGRDDIAALRAAGWDDTAVHDAAQVIAYFNYVNRIAEGLGGEPESWLDPDGRRR